MRYLAPLAAAMAALIYTPSVAQACSCAAGLVYALPTWNSTDVPLNPEIRLGYAWDPAPTDYYLVGDDDSRVPLASETQVAGGINEVVLNLPDNSLLQANAGYRLMGDGQELLQFTSGQTADYEAPSLERISTFEGGFDDGCTLEGDVFYCNSCGPSTMLDIDYEGAADDRTPADELLYKVYVEVDGAEVTGESESVFLTEWWALGSGGCSLTYEGLEVGDTVSIRAQTVDAAGNFSPLTDTVTTIVQDDPDVEEPVGCSSASRQDFGGLGSAASLLLLLSVLGIRRRS